MIDKKTALIIVLSLVSILLGGVIGALDFFGFVNGQHEINITMLIFSLLLMYLATVTTFVLDFSDKRDLNRVFAFVTVFFMITFFIVVRNALFAIICAPAYFLFLHYLYASSEKRAALFVKFRPKEIFFPVLKNSFFYIFLLLAIIAFFQAKARIEHNNLVSPRIVETTFKPMISILNIQLSSQIQAQFGPELTSKVTPEQKETMIRQVLKDSIKSTADKRGGFFGLKPENIPIEAVSVSSNGNIDLTPVLTALSPLLSQRANQLIKQYSLVAPFIIAFAVTLILQPFLLPVQWIEMGLTALIFSVLIRSGFLTVKKEAIEAERIIL